MKKLAIGTLMVLGLAGCRLDGYVGETSPELGPNAQWMQHYQDRRLAELTMPGSHDTGTHWQVEESAGRLCIGGAFFNVAMTQRFDLLGQMQSGARVFDIRPVLHKDGLYTAHATHVKVDALGLDMDAGCRGQSLDSSFAQLKTFLDTYPTEVVIFNVGHIHRMVGMFSDASATDVADQFKQLAQQHLGDLLFVPQAFTVDQLQTNVWDMRLADLVARNKRAIINMPCEFVDVSNGFLGCLSAQQDEPLQATLPEPDGLWANSPHADVVIERATNAWLSHRGGNPDEPYAMSWTATMDDGCVANAYAKRILGQGLADLGKTWQGLFQAGGIDVEAYRHCTSILTMSTPLNEQFVEYMQRYAADGTFCHQQRPAAIHLDFVDVELGSAIIALNDSASYSGNHCL